MFLNKNIVLLDHHCDCCRYFTSFAKIVKLSITTIDAKKISSLSTEDIIVTCSHQSNLLDKSNKLFILITDNADSQDSKTLNIPFDVSDFKNIINQINNEAHHELNHPALSKFVGKSKSVIAIKQTIVQIAKSDSNILLHGESGTGKDVIASCIHQLSPRSNNPYIPLNCGAIPSELIESELFGHEKGAFTGASTRRPGRFEIANGGTLFLDEIGDMPLGMQVKLLRVIQDKVFERVGSSTRIESNVRIISASNKNLQSLIDENLFRSDLYYRLNVIPISIPPLRERKEDIPDLIEYFHKKISERIENSTYFSPEAIESMCSYDWPGNIRELSNFIERMIVMHNNDVVDSSDILNQIPPHHYKPFIQFNINMDNINFKEYINSVEMQLINIALEKSNGIVSTAAEYLNIGRTTLIEKMKKLKLTMAE